MGGLQGLLLLQFLTAVVLVCGAFLKMLGTHPELAQYPHSQRLQQAEQVLSSWLDPAWSAMGKAFYQLSLGQEGLRDTCLFQLAIQGSRHSLFPPALLPGASEFGFLATNRAL